MTKYLIPIGKEFDVEVELDEPDAKEPKGPDDHRERMRVVTAVFCVAVAFLGGAAILGVVSRDFSALNGVWSVVSVPVSSIITFYFTRA